MARFTYPDANERINAAAAAKKAMLEKFKKAVNDPELEKRKEERAAIAKAREERQAVRAAEAARQAEILRQQKLEEERQAALRSAEEAELAAQIAAEEAAAAEALKAEQKAARDARYAARKLAKKERRKGTSREY